MKSFLKNVKAQRLYLEGTAFALKGQYSKAIEILSRAIEVKSDYFDAYMHRGIAYIDIGDARRAVADLNTAIQGMPENALAYYNRSIAFMELEDSESALLDINKAIQLDPTSVDNITHRCIIYTFRKENNKAIQDATEAITLGAGKSGYNNRAIVLENNGDYAAAIEDWDMVLEFEPNNAAALCRRGRVFSKLGDNNKAIADIRKGLLNEEVLGEKLKREFIELLHRLEAGRN